MTQEFLPPGWIVSPLSALVHKVRGVSYERDEAAMAPKDFYIPIVRANNIQDDRLVFDDLVWVPANRVSDQQMLRKGDIVVAMSSGSKSIVGKTAQVLENWQGAFGTFCGVLRPLPGLNASYLGLFLRSRDYCNKISDLSAGTNINNLKNEHFDQIEVPVAPILEQRRVVASLETLLARVNTCQKRLVNIRVLLTRFRQSVLAAACSGRLTADWREEHPNVKSATAVLKELRAHSKETKIRRGVPERVAVSEPVASWEMPATWTVASAAELLRLGAFIDLKDGNHGSNHPKVAEFTEQGLPFITAAQVNNFNIDYDGAYKVSGGPLRRLRVGFAKPGDVIFTHKGSVGRVAVADRDCVLTPQTTYYRVAEDVFVNRYLMLFLASQPFAAQVAVVKEQTTRDFVPISEQYLLFHRIPPLAEQQEIVRRVESLFAYADSIDARYAKAHNQVNNIAQSIIAKAFRGDLVPTEVELAEAESRPYETGAELLDRIRRAGPTVAMRRASINRPATSNRGLKARGTKR